jgi:hypothetical protein
MVLAGSDGHRDKVVPFGGRINCAAVRLAIAEPNLIFYSASDRATMCNGRNSLLFERAYSVRFRQAGTLIGIKFGRLGVLWNRTASSN